MNLSSPGQSAAGPPPTRDCQKPPIATHNEPAPRDRLSAIYAFSKAMQDMQCPPVFFSPRWFSGEG